MRRRRDLRFAADMRWRHDLRFAAVVEAYRRGSGDHGEAAQPRHGRLAVGRRQVGAAVRLASIQPRPDLGRPWPSISPSPKSMGAARSSRLRMTAPMVSGWRG
ncbi:hypothetical protein NL676_013981 [Syzygium grande]|nr:hypothetical protein NL676_013981 [Syzygium grande]